MRRSPTPPCGHAFLSRLLPALLIALAILAAPPADAAGNGKLQIHHVDVGQGDGILLISPNGQTALFDDGNYLDCSGIKTYLQGLGLTVIDYHFCSHYHADHLGCIDDLATIGITIGTAGYDRGYSYSSASYTSYVNTLGARRTTIAKGQVVTLDAGAANPVAITCVELNGAGAYSVSGSDENPKSLVLKVTYGAFDEVIGGDLTGDAAAAKDVETVVGPLVGDVEVYKVHHHGSRYSTNDNWLNAITPEVGIISCGDGNSYGHPTTDALARLHAHAVRTYWTETGAGATPDPAWDRVGGTIVVQADPGAGATYTVAGTGFTDSYTNGGGSPPPPPIHATEVAEAIGLLKGSISAGDVTRLAANDAVRVSISAGVENSLYVTDWYGSVVLDHPPLNLAITYDGNYTVSRTQTLYLWNWQTSAWVQVQSGSVGTGDVTANWSTTSPAAYVSATREVRLRVRASTRKQGSYTARGDYMAFAYDYTSGTVPQTLVASLAPVAAPHSDGDGHVHAPDAALQPQVMLRRVDAAPSPEGVTLTWVTGNREHVDGFNIYRQAEDGSLVFAGNEADLENIGNEVRFRFVDAATRDASCTGIYWLGVRSCSAPEGMIGPIEVAAAETPDRIALSATPNPARIATLFRFAVARAGEARLDVFDLQGRRVATPYAGRVEPGLHAVEWPLTTDAGAARPGVYFARLQSGGRTTVVRVNVVDR